MRRATLLAALAIASPAVADDPPPAPPDPELLEFLGELAGEDPYFVEFMATTRGEAGGEGRRKRQRGRTEGSRR